MTMIRKCWTGIREMNKYESTRGGMRFLELFDDVDGIISRNQTEK
jgi:hypothetical protein